jgi:hypothetical protein
MHQLTLQITDTKLEEFLQKYGSVNESTDPWENPNIALPSIDTGITDFARHHDHYYFEQAGFEILLK